MSGDHKTSMLAKWPHETSRDDRVAVFAERFPTVEKLHEFHEDTRKLSWPETCGQSPWGFSSMVAHLVFTCEAKVPDHFHEPWRSDLVRAIEGLENRYILDGRRADVFMGAFFRAVAREMQDQPVRHAAFQFDGLAFRDVRFIAVLEAQGDDPLDGVFHLYRSQRLPTQQEAPIGVYPVREVIKPPSAQVDLTELSRIFRFGNGRDGFQWGDTRRTEGNYGAETLACLTLKGYARRTGNSVSNGLGGGWPEVEVTPAGTLALMQSKVLGQVQKEMEASKIAVPVATIASSAWGEFDFCARTGAVLGVDPAGVHPISRIEDMPVRIDIAELTAAYPDEDIAGQTYDVLDVGYWTADGRYEAPEEDFREELRRTHAAP